VLKFYKKLACSEINKIDVEDWLNNIKTLKLSKNSIHAYGKQLTHFLNFLFEYNYTPMFKINKEVKTRPEIKEKIVFTDEAIIKIFDSLKDKNENFRTSIYLLFYTGLRSSDLLTITKKRVNLKEKTLSYYSPKRKVYREVAFHDDLVDILSDRLKNLNDDDQVLNYKIVENLGRAVKRFLDDLGFEGMGYTARTFRKTFITLCRSRFKMDASIVRELVGHTHSNTADRYYNEIGLDAMREELKKFKRPLCE
jgi:integrase